MNLFQEEQKQRKLLMEQKRYHTNMFLQKCGIMKLVLLYIFQKF